MVSNLGPNVLHKSLGANESEHVETFGRIPHDLRLLCKLNQVDKSVFHRPMPMCELACQLMSISLLKHPKMSISVLSI